MRELWHQAVPYQLQVAKDLWVVRPYCIPKGPRTQIIGL